MNLTPTPPGPERASAAADVPGAGAGASPDPRWARPLILLAATLSLLLLGAAGALVITGTGPAPPDPVAGSVDAGFAQDMTVHHQQAVEMAAWERDHTGDAVLRQLAFDIESTQTEQIGRMQGWLELWGLAGLPAGEHMAWMSETGGGHDHAGLGAGHAVAVMPGMAGSEQLRAMRAATGTERDVLFLQLMLRHHQGGAPMLDYAARHAELPQVRNLAAQSGSSQAAETVYLHRLLAERGGTPLPL